MSYTKGQWKAEPETKYKPATVMQGENPKGDCMPLAHVFGLTRDERTANAKLISAAPDLLEALKGVLPVFDNTKMQVYAKVYADRIAQAEAAIDKAEGKD